MTLWSWSRIFEAPIDRVVEPAAMPVVDRLAGECIESIYDMLRRRGPTRLLEQSFLAEKDFYRIEPWRELMTKNTPGTLPPHIPVFLAQGGADQLVRPQVTHDYMKRLCAAGSKVQWFFMPTVNHGFAARNSALAAVAWMADRFAGTGTPNDCGTG
jgi:acetyl esterase/lipase